MEPQGIYLNGLWLTAAEAEYDAEQQRIERHQDDLAAGILAYLAAQGQVYYSDSLPMGL